MAVEGGVRGGNGSGDAALEETFCRDHDPWIMIDGKVRSVSFESASLQIFHATNRS